MGGDVWEEREDGRGEEAGGGGGVGRAGIGTKPTGLRRALATLMGAASRHWSGRHTGMRNSVAAWAAAIFAALVATSAAAQSAFPTRTVKFIVPFPGGGINDLLARIIGEKLQAKW